MLRFAADAITGFSTKPLRVASYLGLMFGAVGLVLLIYILISLIASRPVAGWTSLIAVVVVLGSATLVVLGVIGEYIGRIYVEVKGRPLYLVSEVEGGKDWEPGSTNCPHCGEPLETTYVQRRKTS
jgi:dolichol-phosphate mannosyltransferase